MHAIAAGTVVYAGPAEAGALTVAIRHDTTVAGPEGRLRIFSVYYHNSSLAVKVGQRVGSRRGDLAGRQHRSRNERPPPPRGAHRRPTRFPPSLIRCSVSPYTTNPELWIDPLPGTGIVAGQVFNTAGEAVPQADLLDW